MSGKTLAPGKSIPPTASEAAGQKSIFAKTVTFRLTTIVLIAVAILAATTAVLFLEVKYRGVSKAIAYTVANPLIVGFSVALVLGIGLFLILRYPKQSTSIAKQNAASLASIEQEVESAQNAYTQAQKDAEQAQMNVARYLMTTTNVDRNEQQRLMTLQIESQNATSTALQDLNQARQKQASAAQQFASFAQ